MAKYLQNGNKSKRISVRCTKQEKERLQRRAKSLGMDEAEYLRKTLFPLKSGVKDREICMDLLIELQDLAVDISTMYKDDTIQEELDCIWEMIKILL